MIGLSRSADHQPVFTMGCAVLQIKFAIQNRRIHPTRLCLQMVSALSRANRRWASENYSRYIPSRSPPKFSSLSGRNIKAAVPQTAAPSACFCCSSASGQPIYHRHGSPDHGSRHISTFFPSVPDIRPASGSKEKPASSCVSRALLSPCRSHEIAQYIFKSSVLDKAQIIVSSRSSSIISNLYHSFHALLDCFLSI